jgi:hypothetical protein
MKQEFLQVAYIQRFVYFSETVCNSSDALGVIV